MPRFRTGPAIVFSLLVLLNLGHAQSIGRGAGSPVSLAVRITWDNDRPARLPLYVQLVAAGGAPVASGYTDIDGRLGLGQVTPGYYRVYVSGQGIQNQEEQFYVEAGQSDQVQIVHVHAAEKGAAASTHPQGVVAVADLKVPKQARKEFDKGNREATRKNWTAALEDFQAAIRDYPPYARAYNNLGFVLVQVGDVAGARAAFQKAIEVNDHYAHAYVNLGHLLYNLGDYAGAESAMSKAVAVDPRNLEALMGLASAQLSLGEYAQSADNALKVETLEQVSCDPQCPSGPEAGGHHPASHFIAGKALALSHKVREAAEQFKRYLSESPDGPLATQAVGELNSLERGAKPQSP